MYRNIIFDIDGVVVEYNPRDFLMELFMNRRAEDETYDLTFGSRIWEDLELGGISRAEANQRMLRLAAQSGRAFEVRTVLEEWETMLRTKKHTIKTMCRLKMAGCRLYYLTNIASDTLDHIRQRDFFPLFDGGVASCEAGLRKPDLEIFTLLMKRYGLAYDETIFVDDEKQSAQAAYNLGITGILYKNRRSFNRALETCGIPLARRSAPRPTAAAAAQ